MPPCTCRRTVLSPFAPVPRTVRPRRILAAALLLWLLAAAAAGFGLLRLEALRGQQARFDAVARHAEGLLAATRDTEASQRGFLLTGGRERYLDPYEAATRTMRSELAALAGLARDEAALSGAVEALAGLVPQKIEEMERSIALHRGGEAAAAVALVATDEGKALTDAMRAEVARVAGLAAAARAAADARLRSLLWLGFGAAGLFGLAALGLVLLWVGARQAAAARLRSEQARFSTLAEALPGFVWTATPDGRLDDMARPWKAWAGSAADTALGEGWAGFLHPDDREAAVAAWARSIATGLPFEAEFRLRRADGAHVWFLTRALPECDAAGRVTRWVGVCTDIHERHKAEAALRASEERFRLALRAAQAAIYDQDLEAGTVLRSADHARLFGHDDASDAAWRARIHPEDAPGVAAAMEGVLAPGGPPGWDLLYRLRHAHGGWRHVQDRALVQRGPGGRARRVVGSLLDLTAQRAQEAANARLAAIVASSADAIVSFSEDGRIQSWNGSAEELFGWAEAEAIGAQAALLIPPGLAYEGADDILLRALGGERVQDHETERLTRGGERIPVGITASRIEAQDGRALGVAVIYRDLRPRREAEARQTLLMREVDHRAKNVLAVVQSVLRLTRADSAPDFARAVEGRVAALGRAHTLLARHGWAGAGLREILEEELAPLGKREDGRILLSGPPVRVEPVAVQPLCMALHELATNAARHGALSVASGRLEVGWQLGGDGRLRIAWRELDGPPVLTPPGERGFGLSVIEATLRRQLGGGMVLDWAPEGLVAELVLGPGRAKPAPGAAPEAAEPPPGAEASLRGRRILLAEDEPMLALEVRAMLEGLGCLVSGPAGSLEEAMRMAAAPGLLDAAVLDVNLQGRPSFPAADRLAARGVPVVFVTGYGDLPPRAAADGRTALLRKPLERGVLGAALRRLLGAAPPEGRDAARG